MMRDNNKKSWLAFVLAAVHVKTKIMNFDTRGGNLWCSIYA